MRFKYRALCLLLLLLCLTACGRAPEDDPDLTASLTGRVYVPEFFGAETDARQVEGACVSGGTVWLAGSVSWTVEMDNGSGGTFSMDIAGTALFHGGIEGGSFREAEGYRPRDFLDDGGGYVHVRDCWPGRDGEVWTVTSVIAWGDRPSTDYLQHFDANGKELLCIDLGTLGQEADWISGVVTDGEGRLYLALEDSVTVFDRDQELLCTLDAPDWARWDALVLLGDGRAALRTSGAMPGDTEVLRAICPESGDWGESYTLPASCGSVYSGGGSCLFFCDSGDALYGYSTETGALERLWSWTGVNINSGRVHCLSVLEDGRLAVVTDADGGAEIAVLTPADPDALPEMMVLAYATLSLDGGTRARIVEFNKAHTDCRIEARDYSEYGDPAAARTRLHTEILAGNIPDLLDTRALPVRQYGRRGYLVDLLPYLESDPDLGREAVMERVLDAALQDGKLYQAFPSFTILTAAGRPGLAGERTGWTWEDLRAAMAALPEGSTAFGSYERSAVLELLLPMTVDALVDWEAGAVREDAVRSLLEFCGTTPLRPIEETDPYAATLEGTQLLLPIELCVLDWEAVLASTAFGGACSYVGYPREDGGAGSCFRLMDGAAMTTACKDKEAAWEFLREAFLPRYPTGIYFGGSFPINRADFERMAEQSTGPLLDETGQPMEGAVSGWVIPPDSALEIPARPLTQEEFDQFMALYNAIDRAYDPDEDLTAIIREEAGAYLNGIKSLEDAVRLIKSRAGLYLSEIQ